MSVAHHRRSCRLTSTISMALRVRRHGNLRPSFQLLSGSPPVTHLNDALLAQLDLPKMESFWFTAADGTKLQGFLIRPPGFDPAKKYPVKFLIHGGPQGAWGDAWSYRWNAELFAANGYVVVMINLARLDRLRAGVRGWRQRRLGRQALHRPDAGPGLRRAALSLHRQEPRVRAGRQLRRLHGQLGSGPHQPLQVHRQPRRHVQRRIGLRDDGRAVVQRVGVQGQALGLLRQAGLRRTPSASGRRRCRPRTSRRPRWSSTASSTTGSM